MFHNRRALASIRVPFVAAAAFTPASLSGLKAWYSADSGVYNDAGSTLATNGQTVQQWNDRSGNSYHLRQATGANRPTYLSAGFNSHAAVSFDASNANFLATTVNTVAMGAVAVGSAFAVVRFTGTPTSNSRCVGYMGNGQTDDFTTTGSTGWLMLDAGHDNFTTYRGGFLAASAAVVADTDYRVGVIFDGTNCTNYLNNTASATAAMSASFTSPGTIVAGSAETAVSSSAWNGMIVEIVITNTALSSGDRSSLQTYFTRWS